MKIYSVSELNIEAREAILLAFQYPVTVKGEISDYRTSRGHQYFKLRDSNGNNTVSCVVWKGTSHNLNLSEYLHMEVVVSAKVDFYAGFGQFQLNVIELSEFSDGFIKKEIEKLKKKLSDDGVFDNKKTLPKYPKAIGILTAHDSHALKDVCSKLNEKYPLSNLFVYPSIVQGEQAPHNLIKQLKRINKDKIVDVILIVRGGGSLQDLMAFNDESLVREISKSSISTITGIGHKPDITLADYAADSAQETPTAAAVKSVPDCQALKQDINYFELNLIKLCTNILSRLQAHLDNFLVIIKMSNPIKIVGNLSKEFNQHRVFLKKSIKSKLKTNTDIIKENQIKQKRLIKGLITDITNKRDNIDKSKSMIRRYINSKIVLHKEILSLKIEKIKQINPDLLLKKGYAIVRDKNNKIIKSINDVALESDLQIQVFDGLIKVKRKK